MGIREREFDMMTHSEAKHMSIERGVGIRRKAWRNTRKFHAINQDGSWTAGIIGDSEMLLEDQISWIDFAPEKLKLGYDLGDAIAAEQGVSDWETVIV